MPDRNRGAPDSPRTPEEAGLNLIWHTCSHFNKEFNDAFLYSFLIFWLPRVKSALERNHGSHRPSSFKKLADALALHPKMLQKQRGKAIPETLKRYNHAAVLGVPESALSPDNPTLIAGAVISLVQWHLDREVDVRAARAYGGYIATNPEAYEVGPDDEGHLDDEAVRMVHQDMQGKWKTRRELERAILEVAKAVGEVLLLEKFSSLVDRAPRRSTSRRGGM